MFVFERIENALGMGRIRETTEFVREKALEALRDHLIQIGATPTSISKTNTRFSGVIGTVTIANGNIDLVELERKAYGGGQYGGNIGENDWVRPESMYRCSYIVQAKVDGLEKNLKAHSKLARMGILNRLYSTDPKWKGKELAQELNSEALTLLPNVQVLPIRSRQCVVIRQKRYWDSWFSAFPKAEDYKAFDRIAQHVKDTLQRLRKN